MFNPKQLSDTARFIIFLIGICSLLLALQDLSNYETHNVSSLPWLLGISTICSAWWGYEYLVYTGKIEVKPFTPKSPKSILEPDKNAPWYQRAWFYAQVIGYFIWGLTIGLLLG